MALIDPSTQARGSAPKRTNRHLYTDADPIDLVPFADKVNLCLAVDAAARARDRRVAQVSVSLSGSWSRSEEHTSELQSLMRISYAVFCLKKKKSNTITIILYHYSVTPIQINL